MEGIRRPSITVFNVFGHLNMGDAMLVEALFEVLRNNADPCQIQGIAFDVEVQRQWMPQIQWAERLANKSQRKGVGGRLAQAIYLVAIVCIALGGPTELLKRFLPCDQRRAIEMLRASDFAVSCPGGYIEDSNKAYFIALLQIWVATRLSKLVILAPQSIGPIKNRFGRWFARLVLNRTNRIFVREARSEDFVTRTLRVSSEMVQSSGDLAFWYEHPGLNVESEWAQLGVDLSKPILGITIVDWPFPHHQNPKKARLDYLIALRELVRQAVRDGLQVVVFNQVSSDLDIVEPFAEMCPEVIVDRGERSCAALAAMIAGCEIFVGSRFHSAIFALIAAVPTAAVSYLPKTAGIMEYLGLSRFVIEINEIEPSNLLSFYHDLRSDHASISREIAGAVAAYRREEAAFVEYLVA